MSEARPGRKNLVLTWLDIANAYGSMLHKLTEVVLERAHYPEDVRRMVRSYYEKFSIRFTAKTFTTRLRKVEKGITVCTLSVVLFALAMTMLVLSVRPRRDRRFSLPASSKKSSLILERKQW